MPSNCLILFCPLLFLPSIFPSINLISLFQWVSSHHVARVLQEGGPLPGPETGLLSNTQKWIVRGDTCADKARDFIGKGHPGREQPGKGTQENCSATWLTVPGFMVMGLVSRLSSANHSDSESFLVVHTLFSQYGCQREGFWEAVGHVVFPFALSQTLPVGGGLLVLCSLPGPPIVKQLMQMVTMVPGQGGQFQSMCFLYNSIIMIIYNNIWKLKCQLFSRVWLFVTPWTAASWAPLSMEFSRPD